MTRFTKKFALDRWHALPVDSPLNPQPITYGHTGTTYGADGIRIEGSQFFIDAVLGRLSDLLAFENTETRLGLSYQEVEPRKGRDNPFVGNWVCYVKVYERGDQAKMVNAFVSGIRDRDTIVSAGY